MTTLNTRNELTSCCKHSGKFSMFLPLVPFSVQKIIKTLKLPQAKGYIYIEKYLTRGYVSILRISNIVNKQDMHIIYIKSNRIQERGIIHEKDKNRIYWKKNAELRFWFKLHQKSGWIWRIDWSGGQCWFILQFMFWMDCPGHPLLTTVDPYKKAWAGRRYLPYMPLSIAWHNIT